MSCSLLVETLIQTDEMNEEVFAPQDDTLDTGFLDMKFADKMLRICDIDKLHYKLRQVAI